VVMALAASSAFGCIERHWASPAIQGTVFDHNTKVPLERVEIYRVPIGSTPLLVGSTDINGNFTIEASRKTSIAPPTADLFAFGHFSYIKQGYLPSDYEYSVRRPDFQNQEPPAEKGIVIMLRKR